PFPPLKFVLLGSHAMSPTATMTGSPEAGSEARLSGVGHATSTTPPRAIKASTTTATRRRITTPPPATTVHELGEHVMLNSVQPCNVSNAGTGVRCERSWSPGQGHDPSRRHGSHRAPRRPRRRRHPKPATHLPPDQARHVPAGVRRGGGDASGGLRRRNVEALCPAATDLTADVIGWRGTIGAGADARRNPVRLAGDRRRRNRRGSSPSRLGDRAVRGREHTDSAPSTTAG